MSNLRVRDLMTEAVQVVEADDDIAAIKDIMDDLCIRHVPVVDSDGELIGLVSHRDLLRTSLIEQPDLPRMVETAVLERITVSEVMTSCVESVTPDTDIREAAQLMFENKYGCLPVLSGRRLAGILTEADFVRFLAHGN